MITIISSSFQITCFLVVLISLLVSDSPYVESFNNRYSSTGNTLTTRQATTTTTTNTVDTNDDDLQPRKCVVDRRRWIQSTIGATATALILPTYYSSGAANAAATSEPTTTDVEEALKQAKTTLRTLLDNWSNAVIDCTYADVPRDLLAAENKELLLEKAKTSALFDKSASVVSCKTINTKVRDYIGLTGKGPVSVLPKVLKAGFQQMMDDVEDGDLDLYVQTSEKVQQALFKADSLSYEARRDFTSMNNFDESQQEKVLSDPNSNLSQAKQAITAAVDGLDILLKLLRPE